MLRPMLHCCQCQKVTPTDCLVLCNDPLVSAHPKRLMPGVLRMPHSQSLMWPLFVVVLNPAIDHDPGLA